MQPGRVDRDFNRFDVDNRAQLLRLADLLISDVGQAENLVQAALLRLYRQWDRVAAAEQPIAYARRAVVNQSNSWWHSRLAHPVSHLGNMHDGAAFEDVEATAVLQPMRALSVRHQHPARADQRQLPTSTSSGPTASRWARSICPALPRPHATECIWAASVRDTCDLVITNVAILDAVVGVRKTSIGVLSPTERGEPVTAPADLVITGADVYRVDAARSWSDAVAVRGDRIVAVGSAAVGELTGPSTTVLDLAGSLVLPGFQDAHIHPPAAGRNRRNVDLSAISGRDEYLRAIGEFAATHPDREWIIGGGWAMEYFPGGMPRKEDLDAVVGDRPVFLFNRDVHGAWVNSAALRAAGVTKETPDPADGRIERDAGTGEPTGMLQEGAAYTFNDQFVPLPDVGEWQESILEAQDYLHTLGITGWQDAWVTPDTQQAYVALAQADRLSARVVGALWWDRHRGLEQIDELLERAQGTVGRFHPRTVKIMVDGVLENYTGALLQPYCDGCGGHGDNLGLTYVEPELLSAAVQRLDAGGLQVHMHAIGDRAVRMSLDAVQAAREANGGDNDNRHHIAHLQLIQPVDLPRFRELNVVANCQTFWAQSDAQMDELTIPFLGSERADLQYPFADLLHSGATLAMGSDWGVTTADPLQQIEVAVRRIGPDHRDAPAFLPGQRLPLPVAVAAFTAGSAYVNHDDDAGSIEVGRRADLAIVDRNIFDAALGLPADARVTHTVAAGALVYGS